MGSDQVESLKGVVGQQGSQPLPAMHLLPCQRPEHEAQGCLDSRHIK